MTYDVVPALEHAKCYGCGELATVAVIAHDDDIDGYLDSSSYCEECFKIFQQTYFNRER